MQRSASCFLRQGPPAHLLRVQHGLTDVAHLQLHLGRESMHRECIQEVMRSNSSEFNVLRVASDCAQVTTALTGLAELPQLKVISLHGCTAATQPSDAALNKLLKVIKAKPACEGEGHHTAEGCGTTHCTSCTISITWI